MALVIQSFGRESEYRRALFCLLSYHAHSKNGRLTKTILFTDRPSFFEPYLKDFPVHYSLLTEDKIKLMRGEIDFLHRMKIAIIEESFQLTSENLLYVDSDAFFVENPEGVMDEVTPFSSFMHKHEYQFDSLKDMPLPSGAPFHAFYELIKSKEFSLSTGNLLKVPPTFSSWNAGAMAFHRSHQQLLADVYSLTDQFYPLTKNHACEQYAFSIILQIQTKIKPLDSIIFHYWYREKKIIVDDILSQKFNTEFLSASEAQRKNQILILTKRLPGLLENHIRTLRDNAIQAFHEDNFRAGYGFAFRALIKAPLHLKFWQDLGYHTRRWINRSFL